MQHFHVITGSSGAGKSTLLDALAGLGYSVMPEVALAIVQEQEQCGGDLLPWIKPQAFMETVLERNLQAYDAALKLPPPVFFDRGIPECLGHMELLGLEIPSRLKAESDERRYADNVLVAQPWPEIYVCDRWRRADFERAARSFEPTVAAYTRRGYRTCILPKVPVEDRVAYVLQQLEANVARVSEAHPG